MPDIRVPSPHELANLSSRHLLFLASRTVRRAVPLIAKCRPLVDANVLNSLYAHVQGIEHIADRRVAARVPKLAIDKVVTYFKDDGAESAYWIAKSIESATKLARSQKGETAAQTTWEVLNAALTGVRLSSTDGATGLRWASDFLSAVRSDFANLAVAAGTNDVSIIADICGPTWPAGSPEGYPSQPVIPAVKDTGGEPKLLLELSVPTAVDTDVAADKVSKLIQRLNELHHALGGNGLRLRRHLSLEPQHALTPCNDDGGGQ